MMMNRITHIIKIHHLNTAASLMNVGIGLHERITTLLLLIRLFVVGGSPTHFSFVWSKCLRRFEAFPCLLYATTNLLL